jgi:hypothetical protein
MTLAASGCSNGPLDVAFDEPEGAERAACLALDEEIPDTLLGQSARATEPESPFTAAWGAPAITVVCGVPRPRERTPDAQLFEIDGVTWFAQPLTAGTRFTSEDRVANVQVDVPERYRPEADALVELAPAITGSIEPKP